LFRSQSETLVWAWLRHSGNVRGGFAAMLVALPAAVAFGVTVHSAISPQYAAFGMLAGILGANALSLSAPTIAGTDYLINANCTPVVGLLPALDIQLVALAVPPVPVVLMMTVLGILSVLTQMHIAFIGIVKLIKNILKTCFVYDRMTRTRHDPNREQAAQGVANAVASGSVACRLPEPSVEKFMRATLLSSPCWPPALQGRDR